MFFPMMNFVAMVIGYLVITYWIVDHLVYTRVGVAKSERVAVWYCIFKNFGIELGWAKKAHFEPSVEKGLVGIAIWRFVIVFVWDM